MRGRRVSAFVAIGASVGILLLTTAPAHAQDVPLAGILPDLVLREIILLPGLLPPSHVAHFSPIERNDANNPAVGIVQAFNNQLATPFATFPLGSSTGGLTYVFDESLGTLRRGSASFGPLFAERALTIGRGKLSAGFNYQRTSYKTFEGHRSASVVERRRFDAERAQIDIALAAVMDFVVDDVENEVVNRPRVLAERRRGFVKPLRRHPGVSTAQLTVVRNWRAAFEK